MAVLQDYQLDIDFKDALVYYKGPFDEEILVKISSYLREGVSSSRKTTRKVFSIFIELAQNISKYSIEHNHFMDFDDEHGVGVMAIYKNGDRYVVKAGNLMETAKAIELEKKCNEINSLDYNGLKLLRKELNATPIEVHATGGKIGLLQIALKSEHPITINFTSNPDNNYAFVVISTEVTG